MKKFVFTIVLLLTLTIPVSTAAQQQTLDVELTRDWGYGGFSGEIQGTFSLRVSGPDNLDEVHYLLDGNLMGVVSDPPFNFQFHTDTYPPGLHTLSVVGILADGTQLTGAEFTRLFLSAEDAREATYQLLVPMLVGIGGITLLAVLIPLVFALRSEYKFKQYGMAGGAVCKRCQLPFSRNMLSPNMLVGKLERCPHCGKWAVVGSATPQALAEAERRYLEARNEVVETHETEQERLRKSLEETRYE